MAGASSLRHLNPPSPKDAWKRLYESTPGRDWSLELRDAICCLFVILVRLVIETACASWCHTDSSPIPRDGTVVVAKCRLARVRA